MDLSLSQVHFTQVVQNHDNLGNQKSVEASNECQIHDPNRNVSSPREIVLELEPDDVSKCADHDRLVANQEDESEKLIQQGDLKNERSRKRKTMFTGSPRVLRSRSQEKSKAPAQDVGDKEQTRRKKKQIKESTSNEFSKIITHLRYLVNRMNYEKNFIDAYVGEGWKGQSIEKIKPEKELERAKSNILRYQLKTRDLFQRIDTSRAEGRLPESLFDSEGLIDSEDIFCAKCGQKDVQLDNDIILCDGTCERGFHQFCLEPPLLKEQVPAGDVGWLCPACDCKADCIYLLNISQGTNLSLSDTWEKVFPEAAASGNNPDNNFGLPSDDSEDDDYNPNGPEVDEEELSTNDSEFSSGSEDLGAVANNEQDLGLPSQDYEDDDYDPDRVGSDKKVKSGTSNPDFTSDSEDFSEVYKDEGPLVSDLVGNDERTPKIGMENNSFAHITAKRHVERLDYRKLHDEMYGNASSDSSDEDFSDTDAPRQRKHTKQAVDMDFNPNLIGSESTPKRRTSKKLDVETTSSSQAHKGSTFSALDSSGRSSTKSAYRRLGEAATQRLYEYFKENQYPRRDVCENLARELNLTIDQVKRWFNNTRWSFNHPKAPASGTCNGVEKNPLNEANQEIFKTPNSPKRQGVGRRGRPSRKMVEYQRIEMIDDL